MLYEVITHELYSALMQGAPWHRADNYFLLYDFAAYVAAQEKVSAAYGDPIGWARKCWLNLANAGKFSSDVITSYSIHYTKLYEPHGSQEKSQNRVHLGFHDQQHQNYYGNSQNNQKHP